jgi:hypothetical protein
MIGIILVLLLMLAAGIPSPALAAAGDETTVGSLSLVPTFRCISVYASFSGDNNQNNSATMEYCVSGGNWITGHELVVDRRLTIPESGGATNPFYNQWRGSIVGLDPWTTYEVRVTFSDGDNVMGTNPVLGTVTTLDETIPLGTRTAYYVAKNGNDITGDGTLGNPWLTIQHAVNYASAGDTVYIRAGTYNEEVTVAASGTPDNYITLTNYDTETAIIDAQNSLNNNIIIGNGSSERDYINIKGLTVRNPRLSNILVRNGSSHIVIEDCQIEEPGSSSSGDLTNPVRGEAGISIRKESTNIIIRNNTITRTVGAVASWPNTIDSVDAIYFYSDSSQNRGGGHIVFNNTINGNTWWDGISGGSNFAITGMVYRDSDIYNNYITGCADDGIEIEGGDCNVRLWNNRLERDRVGIAFAAVVVGPLYIFRNTLYENGVAFKCGHESHGQAYLYHNVSYSTGDFFSGMGLGLQQTDSDLRSVKQRNNIIWASGSPFYTSDIDTSSMDLDYDSLYRVGTGYLIKWNGTNYNTLAAFSTSTGQEVHGQQIADNKFVNPTGGDFTLQSDSPCIDGGALILGFNDANSAWPYHGAAPDMGAFEYDSGPSVPQPPVLNTIGDKAVSAGRLLQFTVSATDPDNDPLTYSASNLPPWATFTPATRTFSGTASQSGTYTNVQFTVSDGALTDSENITITVTANQAPVLTNPGNKSVDESAALTFTVLATDPDGDSLTYSADNTPSGASFNPTTRTFSWTPSYTQAGTYPDIRFSVTDGALVDSENITITVNNVNLAPVLSAIGNKSVTEGQLLTFTVSATDPDGDSLTYSANNTPAGSSFNGTTHVFTWTPASGQVGTYANVRFAVTDGALTASENITITVSASAQPPSGDTGGGGGGGGSGGGGGGGAAGITSLRRSTTTSGLMVEDVWATDINLKVELYIPKGTIVKNKFGQALTSIRITPKAESQAANSGSEIISQSYEIEPGGATFDASAILIFRYFSSEVPSDIPVSNLYIALWDPEAITWTDLGGTVDANARRVSVPIKHLSTYALMAHNRPASLKVTKFALTPGEVTPGETVTASIEVSNQGDLSGTYEANLKLDDATVQTKAVTLNGGSSETIVFTLTSATVGEHKASLGDMVATFIVKKPLSPAAFTVNELSINPLIADLEKNVHVSAVVKNTGDLAGTYQTILSVDDVAVETKEVTLDGGASLTVGFNITTNTIGQHKVDINGLSGTYEVRIPPAVAEAAPPKLEISSLSVAPSYDPVTDKLISASIVYRMNQPCASFPDARLTLTVFHDGQFLEQVPLLTSNELQADGQTGKLSYVPPTGWETGEYAFRAELFDGDRLVQDTLLRQLTVTPESATTAVSWKILGIIIGAALALGSLIVTLVLYHRRDMLRGYLK